MSFAIGEVQIVVGHDEGKLVSGEDGDVAAKKEPEDEGEVDAGVEAQKLVQLHDGHAQHHTYGRHLQPPVRHAVRLLLAGRQAGDSQLRGRFAEETRAYENREEGWDDVELLLEERRGEDSDGDEGEREEEQDEALGECAVVYVALERRDAADDGE